MRWQGRRQSTNINDARGRGGLGGLGGMGRGGPFAVRRAGGGGIGIIIVVLVVAYFLGINPLELLSGNVSTGAELWIMYQQDVNHGVGALGSFNGFLQPHLAAFIIGVRDDHQGLPPCFARELFAARHINPVVERRPPS